LDWGAAWGLALASYAGYCSRVWGGVFYGWELGF